MGANISTCCTDTTTTTTRRVGGGSSSSSGSDSEEHSSTDTDGSGRTISDNNNNAQQTVYHHHLSNRTQKQDTSSHHHTATTAGSGGATRHPQQQHNSVSTGSEAANPSVAFPTLVLEQQTQSVETTQHLNAATSERIPQPLHTAARNPLVAPVTSSTTPFPSPTDCLFAYDAAASEEDVVSQRRGAMIGVVDMAGAAPTEFEDAFGPRDNTTEPLSHGIQRACSDNNTSSSLHHHHHQQNSSPRQQEFGPTVFHVAGSGGVPAAHLAAEKTVATVVPPSSHSNSTTGHHGVKNRAEGSAGFSSDSQLVMANRNEGSISSNLPSGALENEPSEPPTVFAQQQLRTAQIAANMQQHSAGTIVNSSSTIVPGGTDDDLILSPTSQASSRASTLTQQQANGAVDEEQLHVLSPAAAIVVAEQTIVVVKRHHSAPIVSTTAMNSQGEGEGQGHHTNPLSPGVAPPPPLPQHLPLTPFDSLRSTQRGTGTMGQQPSEQTVPRLVVEVADGVQWGGDRNCAAATSLRHPLTASGSVRSASLYRQVRQQRQQQSAGSDGGGGSAGGGWSSRDSSPLSSVSSVSSPGSESAAQGVGERWGRRRGSSRRSSQDVASASSNGSAGQIRRASRPQRSHNPLAEVETELPHEGAHSIGSGQAAAEILPTSSANILREEVERCIGDDCALLTILSQGSLQKLTPTANAANTAQPEGHRQQPSIFASDGRCLQATLAAAAPTAAQLANNSSTNISSGSATHRSSGSAADAINNASLGVQGLAPYVYSSSMDGGQASASTGGGAEDPYRHQSSLQASSIASVGGLVTVPSGANVSLFSSEGGASVQTPGGYLHQSRLLSGNASGSVGGRSPGGALGASSNSNSQHPLFGGISTSFQTGESLGGGGAASPSYASDPQLFPSSGAPTTGRASSWGLGASGIESTSGYVAGGALEEASGQSGPLLRLHWTNSLLMRMAQGGGGEGASSLPASGMATPVACSS